MTTTTKAPRAKTTATNNAELAHLWANQSRPFSKGSHFYFEGPTIYSYGRHFPLATLKQVEGETIALFNPDRYSQSTAKHQSLARGAARHLPSYQIAREDWASVTDAASLAAALARQAAAEAFQAEANKSAKRAAAARARARAREEKEILKSYPAELAAWRDGGPLPRLSRGYSHGAAGTALRLTERRGKPEIETTRGAFIPAAIARKVWPRLRDAVAAEELAPAPAWVPFFQAPDFCWGDYKGLSLRRIATGSPVELRVGCHTIPFSEVETMAEALGLAPQKEVAP